MGVGKKKERVFMSAFLLPNAGGGQEPNRVRHGRLSISIKDTCLSVRFPLFIRPCGAGRERH